MDMKPPSISRRGFHRIGLGAAAIALPFAKILEARAQAAPPIRFISLFTPIGQPAEWLPDGVGANFSFAGKLSESLEPFKKKILLIRDVKKIGGEETHPYGMIESFTGTRAGSFNGGNWASGISIDQHIARQYEGKTPFRVASLGVNTVDKRGAFVAQTVLSYTGPGQPVPPENIPQQAFDRLFAGVSAGAASPAELAAQKARRKSILDFVRFDLDRLNADLGSEQRTRLDAHLTALRDLEQNLALSGTVAAGCVPPGREALGTSPTALGDRDIALHAKQMMDILVQAMACDLTRVGALSIRCSGADETYVPSLNRVVNHHSSSHSYQGRCVNMCTDPAAAKEAIFALHRFFSEQVAYLLQRLNSIPEAGGTMLDNTVIYWGAGTRRDQYPQQRGSAGDRCGQRGGAPEDRAPHSFRPRASQAGEQSPGHVGDGVRRPDHHLRRPDVRDRRLPGHHVNAGVFPRTCEEP